MTVDKYLKSLDKPTRVVVLKRMANNEAGLDAPQSVGCGTAPISRPTPNGEWVCSDGKWVWVPEIG